MAGLEIVDDGQGMPTESGDPFVAFAHEGASPLTQGSLGMGLTVVKGLAEISHGTLRYLRRHDEMIFELTLPQHGDAAAQPEDHIFAAGS